MAEVHGLFIDNLDRARQCDSKQKLGSRLLDDLYFSDAVNKTPEFESARMLDIGNGCSNEGKLKI